MGVGTDWNAETNATGRASDQRIDDFITVSMDLPRSLNGRNDFVCLLLSAAPSSIQSLYCLLIIGKHRLEQPLRRPMIDDFLQIF